MSEIKKHLELYRNRKEFDEWMMQIPGYSRAGFNKSLAWQCWVASSNKRLASLEQENKIKAQDIQTLTRFIAEQAEENKEMREALEFYADISNWTTFTDAYSEYECDAWDMYECAYDVISEADLDNKREIGGKRARMVLAKYKK